MKAGGIQGTARNDDSGGCGGGSAWCRLTVEMAVDNVRSERS